MKIANFFSALRGLSLTLLVVSPFIILVLVLVVGMTAPKTAEEMQAEKASEAISTAKAIITSTLKDPESAEFKDPVYSNGAVCGRVNAKNSLGGYGGFKRYVVIGPVASLEGETPKFEILWKKACKR